MAKEKTQIRLDLKPNQVKGLNLNDISFKPNAKDLSNLGIGMDNFVKSELSKITGSFAMDSVPLQTTPTITNAVQFFQYWAPKAINIITAARNIDRLAGRTIAGSFEDEEIVTTILEKTGSAQPYTDTANIPFASYNQSFETRSIVRFEEGLFMGYLESLRASKMRIDDHDTKSKAAAEALAIELNNIGFYGYANGVNRTFGFLNDPNLNPYRTVAAGAGGDTTWSSKTFLEITADFITAIQELVTNLRGNFNPEYDSFTVALPTGATEWLQTMNVQGTQSVKQWFTSNYPKGKIESAPELDGANGGSNVFYIYVDQIGGDDVIKQYVVDIFRLIGIEKKAKGTIEDYAAATAGVLVQQPLGVVRYSGI